MLLVFSNVVSVDNVVVVVVVVVVREKIQRRKDFISFCCITDRFATLYR
jgi:hypothetical protein